MKSVIKILLICALGFYIGSYFYSDQEVVTNNYYNKLKSYGYNEEEISTIMNVFSEDEVDFEERDQFVMDIIGLSFFKKENFERYIAYSSSNPQTTSEDTVVLVNVNLDKHFYSDIIEYPTISDDNLTVMVNKYYKLSRDYVPEDIIDVAYQGKTVRIREVVKEDLDALFNAGAKAGYNIYITTAYRSYSFQELLYNNYLEDDGQVKADTYSARPGHSEHQLGLTIDLAVVGEPGRLNENNQSGKWMIANAHKYGFILRYPRGKEGITGYQYEPWHFRYVGEGLATLLYENGWTLEEYYGRQ